MYIDYKVTVVSIPSGTIKSVLSSKITHDEDSFNSFWYD